MRGDVCGAVASALVGIYLGIFTGEMNAFYECEKDGTLTIKGAFWKGETKFDCRRAAPADQEKKQ